MSTTVPSSGFTAPAPADSAEAPDTHRAHETYEAYEVPDTHEAAADGACASGPPARSGADRAAPWGADPYANALRTGRGPLFLRRSDGWLLPLDVERWCSGAGSADLSALHRCEGPVLDIGCGPGRLVAELASLGHRALGIDVSEAAVARTRGLGGAALLRSVFEPLPGEGRWGTLLLLDGNIGIGGDPAALLDRAADLLGAGGLLIAETAPVDVDERVRVRLDDGRGGPDGRTAHAAGHDGAAEPFPWARIGTPALLRHARAGGWRTADQWGAQGRTFVSLRRPVRERSARTSSQSAESANSAPVISSQLPK
ncbi:class I SAM-dependent methyltransferase [Streptomyces sp. C11-1]|uniref:Class I SAM-dependent methyltransferase n=1 Tax=Streptomyces durocortorensis TaxID=2811104 RepID=A0ABY9VU93_9ACTN|nr:class I SAM-dependent methyltransferase [Streptomyces durocortorensis]WNF25337.1 class I SAM-dependent methyltransferase [Streptomyces durocortorensis]